MPFVLITHVAPSVAGAASVIVSVTVLLLFDAYV